jgi:menaquinone-dependent protoporphyrinogen oxidase
MSANILVTWATRYGSTEEVAHAVADELLRQRFTVNAQPMNSVKNLDRYDAVVLGFALYMSRIHKDARSFLLSHREQLLQRPTALFALGPVHAEEKEFVEARRQLDKELAKFPWLAPATLQVFGGKLDPEKLGLPFRLIPALRQMPLSDARDWPSIQTWATSLASLLQPTMAH